jgi:hypothetical protein
MNNITKKLQLCKAVNMEFDEANELFSSETLENMQMAKINGGEALTVMAVILLIGSVVTTIAAGLEIYNAIYGTTPNPNKLKVTVSGVGEVEIPAGVTADSIRIATGAGAGATSITLYGVSTSPTELP